MPKRRFMMLCQLLFMLAVITMLVHQFDIRQMVQTIQEIDRRYLIAALALLILQTGAAAFRWIQLVRVAGYRPPIPPFVGFFAASALINSVVPGGISGDALRIWFKTRHGIPTVVAVQIALLDRIFTLIGLGLLVTLASLVRITLLHHDVGTIDVFALLTGGVILIATVGLVVIAPIVERYRLQLPKFLMSLKHFSQVAGSIFRHRDHMIALVTIVLLGHGLLVMAITVLAWGVAAPLSVVDAGTGIPAALLLSALPVTPGGWGIREGAMVLVLRQFHVAAESALAVSILFGLCSIAAAIPGTMFWLARRNLSRNNAQH